MLREGAAVAETTLDFAGEVSTYSSRLKAPDAGAYTLEILAVDAGQANVGRDARELTVEPE